jgi:hypothetical protein
MPDYGHPLEFGYFLIPDAREPLGVLATARLADRLGYDLLAVQDHPYQHRHLDTLARLDGMRPGPRPAHPRSRSGLAQGSHAHWHSPAALPTNATMLIDRRGAPEPVGLRPGVGLRDPAGPRAKAAST